METKWLRNVQENNLLSFAEFALVILRRLRFIDAIDHILNREWWYKWQLLQVHDILELPTLPNSIKNRRAKGREKNMKDKEVPAGSDGSFFFRRVCICAVINDGVAVTDKKGKII